MLSSLKANYAMVNRGQEGGERAQWSMKAAWLSPIGVGGGGSDRVCAL